MSRDLIELTRWTGEWKFVTLIFSIAYIPLYTCIALYKAQTDRQTDKQTDRESERERTPQPVCLHTGIQSLLCVPRRTQVKRERSFNFSCWHPKVERKLQLGHLPLSSHKTRHKHSRGSHVSRYPFSRFVDRFQAERATDPTVSGFIVRDFSTIIRKIRMDNLRFLNFKLRTLNTIYKIFFIEL